MKTSAALKSVPVILPSITIACTTVESVTSVFIVGRKRRSFGSSAVAFQRGWLLRPRIVFFAGLALFWANEPIRVFPASISEAPTRYIR